MNEKIDGVDAPTERRKDLQPGGVLVIRAGHGANCSSIGSVIDTLFVAALAGGAVFAAIAAAVAEEPIRTVAVPPRAPRSAEPSPPPVDRE
jgi:hypothetical protein